MISISVIVNTGLNAGEYMTDLSSYLSDASVRKGKRSRTPAIAREGGHAINPGVKRRTIEHARSWKRRRRARAESANS